MYHPRLILIVIHPRSRPYPRSYPPRHLIIALPLNPSFSSVVFIAYASLPLRICHLYYISAIVFVCMLDRVLSVGTFGRARE